MKILVGSRRHDALSKARDWFAAQENRTTLLELTDWAIRREATSWGECVIFVEADIPAIGEHRAANVDLIVVFADRLAVCEVKSYPDLPAAQEALSGALAQCAQNFDLVQRHLRDGRITSQQAARPFLFFPNIDSRGIADLTKLQLSTSSLRHIVIAGGDASRDTPSLPNGHPLYLPLAISSRLGGIRRSDRRFFSCNSQSFIKNLTRAEHVAKYSDIPVDEIIPEFTTFEGCVEYLAKYGDNSWHLRFPANHVAGLRPHTFRHMYIKLNAFGVVELCGPFGIGKSALVREGMADFGRGASWQLPIGVVSITKAASFDSLLRSLISSLGGAPGQHEDEATLLASLFAIDGLLWIRSYDASSAPLIKRLLDEALRARTFSNCGIIVESIRPLVDYDVSLAEDYRVRLYPLRPWHVEKILEQIPPGHADQPLVTLRRESNPRIALARWRSGSVYGYESELVGECSWFDRVFDGHERDVARFVMCFLTHLPMAIDVTILHEVALTIFPGRLPSTVLAALRAVVRHLVSGCWLFERSFDSTPLRRTWPGLPIVKAVAVGNDTPVLPRYVRQSIGTEEWNDLRLRSAAALELQAHSRREAAVVLALLRGDLKPFFESQLRDTCLGMAVVGRWLHQMGDNGFDLPIVVDPYLERLARYVDLMFRNREKNAPLPALSMVDAPTTNTPLNRYLWDVIRLVTDCFHDTEADLERFSLMTRDIAARDVPAEALCWLYLLSDWQRDMSASTRRGFEKLFRQLMKMELSLPIKTVMHRFAAHCLQSRGWGLTGNYHEEVRALYGEYFRLALAEELNIVGLSRAQYLFRAFMPVRKRQIALERSLSMFADDGNPDWH